jgi:hypothetical protein
MVLAAKRFWEELWWPDGLMELLTILRDLLLVGRLNSKRLTRLESC